MRKQLFLTALSGLLGLLGMLLISGCGSDKTRRLSGSQALTGVTIDGSTVPDPFPSPSPSISPSPVPSLGVPPYSFRVGTVGYNSVTVKVYTRRKLKVRFIAEQQDELVAGSGFSPPYSQLGVYLSVGSRTTATPMLDNGLNSGIQQQSPVIDFTGAFTQITCAANNPNCLQQIIVTVSKPNYDYWCLTNMMWCPWSHIYDTHPWHGTLKIETDATDPL